MSNARATILTLLLAAFLLTVGCETDESKKPASLPAQANAPNLTQQTAATAKTPAKIQVPAKSATGNDPADALIAQAEKLYAAGKTNYAAGHLEAARPISIRHSTLPAFQQPGRA